VDFGALLIRGFAGLDSSRLTCLGATRILRSIDHAGRLALEARQNVHVPHVSSTVRELDLGFAMSAATSEVMHFHSSNCLVSESVLPAWCYQ